MSMLDFMLWSTYLKLHPFGEVREDLRMAVQTANLVNLHLPKGKKAKVEDFLLRDELSKAPERKQSWEEQLVIIEALAMAGAN